MITLQQFSSVFPNAVDADQWVAAFQDNFDDYQINTPERIAAFISQCGVETGGWRFFEENLNYSAQRMQQVWPKIFTPELAQKCDHNPELVANYAYANRIGNGGPETGDGWRFRGRGPIHLTGRSNYTKFATDTFDSPDQILDNPDLVADDKDVSLKSALWFWTVNNLNDLADGKQITQLSRRVNGGDNGLQQRIDLFNKIYTIVHNEDSDTPQLS
jgi:putative chitinase